jgi:hypothetical protein
LLTSISEDDIETIVASPTALTGSDGNCVAPYGRSARACRIRASPAPRSIHIDAFCRLVAHRPAP